MSGRPLKLDAGARRALDEVRAETGLSDSALVRQGLELVRAQRTAGVGVVRPFEVFQRLDIGDGGHARAPARHAKRAIRELLRGR